MTKGLQQKAAKYGRACENLDALVYINLENEHLNAKSSIPEMARLKSQGWRSVSVIFTPYSVILFANSSAPAFLRNHSGQVLSKWDKWDTLFDEET